MENYKVFFFVSGLLRELKTTKATTNVCQPLVYSVSKYFIFRVATKPGKT